jgi:hypothetical protein
MIVPEDFGTLIENYSATLEAAGAKDVHQMAALIVVNGLLEGCPRKGTERYLTQCVETLLPTLPKAPEAFDDLVHHYSATLEAAGAKDVQGMAYRIVARGMLKRCPRTKGIRRFLTRCVQQLLAEDSISKFEYPASLPKDNAELYSRYRGLVLSCLRKSMRWGPDQGEMDPEQEIWAELIHSNILAKYLQVGVLKRLPATMTLDEVQDYLGIDFEVWEALGSKAPTPVSGHWLARTATFQTTDIQALDEPMDDQGNPLPSIIPLRIKPRSLPASVTDVRKFEIYLRASVNNRIKNMFRTIERRFVRDAPMRNPNVYLSGGGSDSYHVSGSDSEGRDSWESSVASVAPDAETLCDFHMIAENLGALDADGSYIEDRSYDGTPKPIPVVDSVSDLVKIAQRCGIDIDSDDAVTFVQMLSQGWERTEALQFMQRLKRKVSVRVA